MSDSDFGLSPPRAQSAGITALLKRLPRLHPDYDPSAAFAHALQGDIGKHDLIVAAIVETARPHSSIAAGVDAVLRSVFLQTDAQFVRDYVTFIVQQAHLEMQKVKCV